MKDKKKIFVAMHYMELGGAESALLGLLMAVDYSRYDVDLFIYSHQGELMPYIPKEVNLLPEIPVYAAIEKPMAEALKCGHLRLVGRRLLAKLQHRHYRKKHPSKGNDAAIFQYVADAVTPILPKINQNIEYDLAISFLAPHNIVRDKVRAKKKLAWIHTDYEAIDINVELELPVWEAFDHIASISQQVGKSFKQRFPTLAPKVFETENILPLEYIRKRAEEPIPEKDFGKGDAPALLSVGRFCEAKNYDNVPDICRRMIEDYGASAALRWYIIGYGGDEPLIRQKIAEAGMEKNVILLGKRSNPYPYIKACDIYVQPSRYEGKSVTVREAQILGKPVAITAYPTAASQIDDGIDGVIVPLDNDGCARELARFISDKPLRKKLIAHLSAHDFAGLTEIQKIYNLING